MIEVIGVMFIVMAITAVTVGIICLINLDNEARELRDQSNKLQRLIALGKGVEIGVIPLEEYLEESSKYTEEVLKKHNGRRRNNG